MFKTEEGKDAESFKEKNPRAFMNALNRGSGALRRSFRAAVRETEEDKNNPALGLSNLFDM